MTKVEAEILLTAIEVLRDAVPLLALEVPVTAPFAPAAEVFLKEAFEAVVRLRNPPIDPEAKASKDREDVLAVWRATMAVKNATP